MSQPGVAKAAGADAQMFLLADHGLALYSNGILVREDYLKANGAQVKAFIKASLDGWRDTVANPREAADIVVKHIKGLDPEVTLQEIAIVNALVVTPQTRADGLGTIDDKTMQSSVDLIAGSINAAGKVAAKDAYDAGFLPQPPVRP
jgi:NitT/TauT family transport system substrate-binding protein